eukprot:g16392.t2
MKASSVIVGTAAVFLATTLAMASTPEYCGKLGDRASAAEEGGRGRKKGKGSGCEDPVQAVLDLLECVAEKDGECAAASYDPGFQRFHNEKFTGNIPVSTAEFWEGAFAVVSLAFDIRFTSYPAKNMASVRYVEEVVSSDGTNFGLPASSEYPFSVTTLQHEHALVTLDDDCKIMKWDQYGDDMEQTDVDDVVADLLCETDPKKTCSDA